MKKILVPTDFSDVANNAFVHALGLAKLVHGELILLHTYELPIVDNQFAPQNYKVLFDSLELSNFERFKNELPKLHKLAEENGFEHIKMSHMIMDGDLIYNIKEIIKNDSIDFVVMGTTGNTGFDKVLFGSNTMNAIRNLKIPVLSVPHKYEYKGINSIGFTTIFEDKDRKALDYLTEMAYRYKAKIHCMHVSKDGNYDIPTLNHWKEYYKNEPVDFSIYTADESVDAVLEFIKDEKIDLLTVVSRNKGFFEKLFSPSFTKKILSQNAVPLFVFHE